MLQNYKNFLKISRYRKDAVHLATTFVYIKCSDMCNFQNLVSNTFGHVQICRQCKCYHICFHSAYIALADNNFNTLQNMLAEKINCYECIDGRQLPERCIHIPSPVPGFGLILTISEAVTLYNMLEEAKNELAYLNLLQLFHKQ